MKKINNKKKMIIWLLLCLILVALLIGVSLSLFTGKVEFNRKKEYIELSTTSIKGVTYEYSKPLLLVDAIPGDRVFSSIKVFNPNKKLTASYEIKLITDKNTFTKTDGDNQLVIKIKSLKTSEEKEIDLTDGTQTKPFSLFVVKKLEPENENTYEITLEFKETNLSQDSNKNKTFIGHIEITQSFEPFSGQ